MVYIMEYIVNVDKQGRLVIPSPIRNALGLKNGGKVLMRFDGFRVIMEVIDEELEERVKNWVKMTLSLIAEPFTEEVEESWKWISHEYAKRKLGVH